MNAEDAYLSHYKSGQQEHSKSFGNELLSLMPQVLHGPMAVLCLPILDLNDLIQAAGALTNRVAE